MKLPKPNKKILLITGVLLVGGVAGVAALNAPTSSGADTSPIVQQVNHNTDELANHEARISNTENDVKDLQNKTGTPTSASNTPVPIVATPAASQAVTDPTPAPAAPVAITVTSSGVTIGGQYDGYCHLTYSDGTYDYIKATLTTTHNGNSTSTTDNCKDFVGQAK